MMPKSRNDSIVLQVAKTARERESGGQGRRRLEYPENGLNLRAVVRRNIEPQQPCVALAPDELHFPRK